jgi:glycosyltransferase involved in cell wall biosynthesis
VSAQPLVSVLIPARNAAPWIGKTLESVLDQTWRSIEVIVAEAGSTDSTRDVIRRYESGRVRLLPGSEAHSAAENRNRAARAAQGQFLQFLDADDLLGPDKIRLQVERLSDTDGAVASCEWARFYREPGEARFLPEAVWRDLTPRDWLVTAWTGGQPMMQPGLWLIPRGVAERAGPWNESLTLIDDFDYATRVLLASTEVRFCAGARLYYRSGNVDSLASQRSVEAWRSAWRSLELGTGALLSTDASPASRAACADLFQQLAFDAYGDDDEISALAERRAAELGGSEVRMSGGRLFRLLRGTAGWKVAKRIKGASYRLGYGRVARAKEALLGGTLRR